MSPRFFAFLTVSCLLLPAGLGGGCGTERRDGAAATLPPVGAAPTPYAGTWRVAGRTVELADGESRDIEGTVVLVQEDAGYSAHFDLVTVFPTPDGPTHAQVVGTGSGEVMPGGLMGTAETQIILAAVPGVDSQFVFLPRSYGPRLISRSTTRLNDDGSLTIEIESGPAEGERYRATETTLRATRISPARE